MRSAIPALRTAAIESPPPMIVVPFTLADRARDGVRAGRERFDLEHAHRSVPDDRLRVGDERFVGLDRRRADVDAKAVADPRVVDREHFVRRPFLDLVGDDVIDRQLERDSTPARLGFDRLRALDLVVLDERLPDRKAARP